MSFIKPSLCSETTEVSEIDVSLVCKAAVKEGDAFWGRGGATLTLQDDGDTSQLYGRGLLQTQLPTLFHQPR